MHPLDVEVPPDGEGHIGVLDAMPIPLALLTLLDTHVDPVGPSLLYGIEDQVRLTRSPPTSVAEGGFGGTCNGGRSWPSSLSSPRRRAWSS
jgi:hypothetical protein